MSILIRKLRGRDKESWQILWGGYLEYYRSALPSRVTNIVWDKLIDPKSDLYGFGAFNQGGEQIGLVHYLFHPVTWSTEPRCYLEDLYTSQAARSLGVGRALIEAVTDAAKAKKCGQVYWLTEDYNKRAQGLYDKIAEKTPFIKYQITL